MLDFPANPTQGQVYENWSWDGTKWTPISTGGGATFSISDTPPASPQGNTLWWDSVGGQLYVWYNDGNTTQWVPTTNLLGGLGEAPADGEIYARNGQAGSWVAALPAAGAGRNLLHNSLFRISQRGNGPFTGSVYSADRWMILFNGDTASFTITGTSQADRAAIGDDQATAFLQNTFTGISGAGYNFVCQRIESIWRLSGKTVVVSFWAKASAPLNFGVSMTQNFGTGGSPSPAINMNGVAAALTTSWARYSFTFTLDPLGSQVVGTNGNDYTALNLWYSCGATNAAIAGNIGVQSGTVQLWGVQLEIAAPGQTQPTPLEKIDPQQDLAKCQRFYFVDPRPVQVQFWAGAANMVSLAHLSFPVTMRTTPTIALGSTSGNINANTAATTNIGADGLEWYVQAAAAGTATGLILAGYTASADL